MDQSQISEFEVSLSWTIYSAVLIAIIFVITNYKLSAFFKTSDATADKKTKDQGEANSHGEQKKKSRADLNNL